MAGLLLTGGTEMRYVATLLRRAALGDLERERRKAQRVAVKPLEQAIKVEAKATLPKAGGYAALMGRAVKVTVRTGGPGATVLQARVHARGKVELRDVRAVNNGNLRHPVFGRRGSPWKVTTVRPGFVTRPAARTWEQVYRASDEAHRRYLEMIARA
ncbi:MAG: hypothetical protein ACM30G_17570 [Micromonosporaceae bacterium]